MTSLGNPTVPLIDFCQRLGPLVTMAPSGSPEGICERTIAALDDWRKRKSAFKRA
jgi:hypothetical protein